MVEFEKILNSTLINNKVFTPNLTSKLSYETALKNIKNSNKILDLGCGSGIIGIGLLKNKKNIKIYCSDSSKKAVELSKINFKKNKFLADIRKGDLFSPWKNEKFDYIINDVSGISSLIAKKSPWFKNLVPCNTGKDGIKLTIKIINSSKKFLNPKGKIQIPLISLSNTKKIMSATKKIFKHVKIENSLDWFLPKEMDKLNDYMDEIRKKGHIGFSRKFGRIICNTSILVCTKFKK